MLMADEIQIRASLQITKNNLNYRSYPTDFKADVTGAKGPVPGAITAAVLGTSVSFAELTTPGWCRISNLDDTNYVTVGILDPDGDFYPLFEVLPGEFEIIRLSRFLGQSWGVGTATTDTSCTLHIQADTAACNVLVEAFEA
jgi:hypothetical protein